MIEVISSLVFTLFLGSVQSTKFVHKSHTGPKKTKDVSKDVFSASKYENYLFSTEGIEESLIHLFKLSTTFAPKKEIQVSHAILKKSIPTKSFVSQSGTHKSEEVITINLYGKIVEHSQTQKK